MAWSTLVTETFTDADNTLLESHDANWLGLFSTDHIFRISGNTVHAEGGQAWGYYNVAGVETQAVQHTSADMVGLAARIQNIDSRDDWDGIIAFYHGDLLEFQLYDVHDGVGSLIGSASGTITGNIFRMECIGEDVVLYKDGSIVCAGTTSILGGGFGGIFGNPGTSCDNFQFDEDAGGGTVESGDGSAAGVSTVSGAGSAVITADGSATGTSTVSGESAALEGSSGTSDGSSTATGQGLSIAAGNGASAGTGSVLGQGQSTRAANGSAAGSSTATGAGSNANGPQATSTHVGNVRLTRSGISGATLTRSSVENANLS